MLGWKTCVPDLTKITFCLGLSCLSHRAEAQVKHLKCSIMVLFVVFGDQHRVNNIQHRPSLFDSRAHSTSASYSSTETFSTEFISHPPPSHFLPWTLSTQPNQGVQPFIITHSTLLLFLSPGIGKMVKRLLKTSPSRAQAGA